MTISLKKPRSVFWMYPATIRASAYECRQTESLKSLADHSQLVCISMHFALPTSCYLHATKALLNKTGQYSHGNN